MALIELLDFKLCENSDRGQLISIEAMKNIPFEIKRVYYLMKLNSEYPRGFHAHKELQQVVVCLNGSCRFILDNGMSRESITLNSPKQGLLILSKVWRELYDFSDNCIVMILADNYYDETDYIRKYETFLNLHSDK